MIPATLVGRHLATAKNKFLFTTLGKIIFNQILPPAFPFYLNDLKEYTEGKFEENKTKKRVFAAQEVEKN